jgi:integration host factor subunit alpha
MSLTRSHLVESIIKLNLMSKNQAAKTVETMIEIIKRELERGEDVLITRFGKFCIKNKSPRRGRNPQTGEKLMLPSRKVVRFRCSSVLKKKLNGGRDRTLSRTRRNR